MFGNIGNQGNELDGDFMEAELRVGKYSDFSGVFWPVPEIGIMVLGGGDLQ
jgi:hypothetical protein